VCPIAPINVKALRVKGGTYQTRSLLIFVCSVLFRLLTEFGESSYDSQTTGTDMSHTSQSEMSHFSGFLDASVEINRF
jgi:hypothetical protein